MKLQEARGKAKKPKGCVKKAVGIISGDRKLGSEGSAQRAKGAGQANLGKARRTRLDVLTLTLAVSILKCVGRQTERGAPKIAAVVKLLSDTGRKALLERPVLIRPSVQRTIGLLPLMALLSALPALGQGSSATATAQAEAFVQALNAGNVKILMAVSADPLLFRNQRWQSASDGIGFVLGEAKDETVRGKKERKAFFRRLVGSVKVKKPEGSPAALSSFEKEELKGVHERWAGLELVVFTRGFGDIEHIALVGIDPRSGKVAAFYVN